MFFFQISTSFCGWFVLEAVLIKVVNIKEADYFTPQGEFRVDREGSPVLLNCLMYKMCYYRFGQVYTEQGTCLKAVEE